MQRHVWSQMKQPKPQCLVAGNHHVLGRLVRAMQTGLREEAAL